MNRNVAQPGLARLTGGQKVESSNLSIPTNFFALLLCHAARILASRGGVTRSHTSVCSLAPPCPPRRPASTCLRKSIEPCLVFVLTEKAQNRAFRNKNPDKITTENHHGFSHQASVIQLKSTLGLVAKDYKSFQSRFNIPSVESFGLVFPFHDQLHS